MPYKPPGPLSGCGNVTFNCNHNPERVLPADPDIAGIGVLVAFSATSVFTFLAITAGYFFDAIQDQGSDSLLNDLDIRIIRRCKRCLGLSDQRVQDGRCEALQRFVLSLSDQQIVTGLAIFIIGYVRHCAMSSYHFFIIVALGWFSSTTHLSTLTLLRIYFQDFPALKYVRLVGMVATFVMLFVGMLVLYTTQAFDVYVQCRLVAITLAGTKPLNYLCAILLLFGLTFTFLTKSLRFCSRKRGGSSASRAILFRLLGLGKGESITRKDYCVRRLRDISQSQASSIFTYIQGYLVVFGFVYNEFLDSFLWQIMWLFFGNFYGLRQLVWARRFVRGQVKVKEGENELNFGQLLALFLLLLPVLLGVEAYHDIERKSNPHDEGETHSNITNNSTPFSNRLAQTSSQELIAISPVAHGESSRAQRAKGIHVTNFIQSSPLLGAIEDPNARPLHQTFRSGTRRLLTFGPPWALTNKDDPYTSPAAIPLLGGLLIYTLTTLIVVAWYIGYNIDRTTYTGVGAGLIMGAILLIAAIGANWQEYRRLKSSTSRLPPGSAGYWRPTRLSS